MRCAGSLKPKAMRWSTRSLGVGGLDEGIGHVLPQGRLDAGKVTPDLAGELDERGDSTASGPGQPLLEEGDPEVSLGPDRHAALWAECFECSPLLGAQPGRAVECREIDADPRSATRFLVEICGDTRGTYLSSPSTSVPVSRLMRQEWISAIPRLSLSESSRPERWM